MSNQNPLSPKVQEILEHRVQVVPAGGKSPEGYINIQASPKTFEQLGRYCADLQTDVLKVVGMVPGAGGVKTKAVYVKSGSGKFRIGISGIDDNGLARFYNWSEETGKQHKRMNGLAYQHAEFPGNERVYAVSKHIFAALLRNDADTKIAIIGMNREDAADSFWNGYRWEINYLNDPKRGGRNDG
jgi:hypothetical protein